MSRARSRHRIIWCEYVHFYEHIKCTQCYEVIFQQRAKERFFFVFLFSFIASKMCVCIFLLSSFVLPGYESATQCMIFKRGECLTNIMVRRFFLTTCGTKFRFVQAATSSFESRRSGNRFMNLNWNQLLLLRGEHISILVCLCSLSRGQASHMQVSVVVDLLYNLLCKTYYVAQ